jgi:precorrin-6x reductase
MTGLLNLVSVGPGFKEHITPAAEHALEQSEIIVGYELYLTWIKDWLASKSIHTTPLTQERERAHFAVSHARLGKTVALVSSGDIGIYGMGSLAFESMSEEDDFDVRIIPGITAANSCASLLGAPLSHDFATLSLSDLLCPWEWIANRAHSIAQADLAAVLYNVQSKQRKSGIYRILEIMLEHKSEATLCGIVRSAYRPGQSTTIKTLLELMNEEYDMVTSIIIGNRFTRRKRSWIYTPRGYNDWTKPDDQVQATEFPQNAIWVFSGTSDGNTLANEIALSGFEVVVSTATEYGGTIAIEACRGIHVVSARRGREQRKVDLQHSNARMIVDATHPYAEQISLQLMEIARDLGIKYLRFERPSSLEPSNDVLVCPSIETASRRAIDLGKRIFLSTGSNDLSAFLNVEGAKDRLWFVRTTPDPEFIQKAIEAGIPRRHICAMQGPISPELNEALWRDWQIDCVITKDSGEPGGFTAKLEAACALGITTIVVQRPRIDYPAVAADFRTVVEQVSNTVLPAQVEACAGRKS